MTGKCAIGVDYGTESCRAVVFDIDRGEELAAAVFAYTDGVIDTQLPTSGEKVGYSWALQNPSDHLTGLRKTVREAVAASGVAAADIIGIGVDATACTILPTDEDLVPLALDEKWAGNPYAWPRLWKDHSSQEQADRINDLASARSECFLDFYGQKLSSEWAFPKLLKMFEEAPDVFAAAYRVLELQDWIVSTLVGKESRAASVAGYKETFQPTCGGYPSAEFLEELSPGFSKSTDLLGQDFLLPGAPAGQLCAEWADELGLNTETVVAAGNSDAHVAAVGVGIWEPNQMLLVMGTSVCNLMFTEDLHLVEGVAGIAKDGLIPGYWAYEAGQSGVGDTFGWFVENLVPNWFEKEAERQGTTIFGLLEQKAADLKIGESGILSLDWFNGNRSTLQDGDLSGLILGLTVTSKPEDIYRSLLESAAFGQREIFDAFEASEVPIDRVVIAGGIGLKSPLLMQMLADVLERPIEVSSSKQGPAVGAAMHAALAAGADKGGFADFREAAAMAPPTSHRYVPIEENVAAYAELLALYRELYREFGKERPERMHLLRTLAKRAGTQTK